MSTKNQIVREQIAFLKDQICDLDQIIIALLLRAYRGIIDMNNPTPEQKAVDFLLETRSEIVTELVEAVEELKGTVQ